MSSWILGPIDRRSEIWNTYPAQRIVIEAQAEWEARAQVAEAAPELHPANPWLDASQTTCEEITPPQEVLKQVAKRQGRKGPLTISDMPNFTSPL